MAYRDDVAALGADHHWPLDTGGADLVGAATATVSGAAFTGSAVAEDSSGSVATSATGNRVSFPATSTIDSGTHTRKAVGGWFLASAVNQPFTRIYGEGNAAVNFQFVLGMGNRVLFQARTGSGQVQVYSDGPLVPNRPYHLFATFSGTGFDDDVSFYVDGVLQSSAVPAGRQIGEVNFAARSSVAELGDPAGVVGLDGTTLLMVAPVNGQWAHWATWANKTLPTPSEIRGTLFEGGALADSTVPAGSAAAMQTAIDALASTVRPDTPLCLRIEDVTGGGDLTLNADNITFDAGASIHIQWLGTGSLTWVNSNGSNAAIASTPEGGAVVFVNPATLTVSDLVAGSEIRVYEAGTANELAGIENSSTSFSTSVQASAIDLVILSLSHENIRLDGLVSTSDIEIVASQFIDRQYS